MALAGAFLGSVGLLVAAVQAPVYQWSRETTSGRATHGSSTLVEVNGSSALLAVGLPLLATTLVSLALWWRGADQGAGPIAWTCVGLLAAVNLLGMLTIGLFMVPVTVCLVIACALHGERPS